MACELHENKLSIVAMYIYTLLHVSKEYCGEYTFVNLSLFVSLLAVFYEYLAMH